MKSRQEIKTLKNHFTYSWWKYLIVLIVGVFGVDLLYTVTEPKVPDSLKIEMIVCGASLDQDFGEYMERVRVEQMPDMLKTELSVIPDDDTAIQYLTVRIGTQGGDVYLLPKDEFDTIALNGALLPLEDDKELMDVLQVLNVESGRKVDPDSRDSRHLYGIPLNIVQSIVGHMTPEMTAHYSAHASLEAKREKMKQLPDFMGGLRSESEQQQEPPIDVTAVAIDPKRELITLIQDMCEDDIRFLLHVAKRRVANEVYDE